MIESIDHAYTAHGHHRSLSSLASSIMPLASDVSALTSMTASPLDPPDMTDLPVELKIPLPSSASSSDDGNSPARTEMPLKAIPVSGVHDELEDVLASDSDMIQEDTSTEKVESSTHLRSPHKGPSPTLDELATLSKQYIYEEHQLAALRAVSTRMAVADTLNKRLKHSLAIAYGNMIDQYKGDDQAGFTGLYEASERLISHTEITLTGWPPPSSYVHPDAPLSQSIEAPVQVLSRHDQDVITTFISRLRTDLSYLSDLITNLPAADLASLTASYHPAGVDLSVLANHSHGRTQVYSRDSQMMKLSRRMDSLDRFHIQDPFFSLLYGIWDWDASSDSQEHAQKVSILATTCAAVMVKGTPGSEEFAIATIDAFASAQDWILKPEIELYILNLLSEGAFLLDPPAESTTDSLRTMEPDRASYAIAVAEFFDQQTRKLFGILTSCKPQDAVPRLALQYIHETLANIHDPYFRELAKKFIVSRWYFAIFLSSVLVYPEVQGLLLKHHIGASARKLILKELVLRIQAQMFAVLSPSTNYMFILPETQDHIHQIIKIFDPSEIDISSSGQQSSAIISHGHPRQLMLNYWDIIGLIETLHPHKTDIALADVIAPASTSSSATLTQDSNDNVKPYRAAGQPSYARSASTDDTFVAEENSSDIITRNARIAGDFVQEQDSTSTTIDWIAALRDTCVNLRSLARHTAHDIQWTSRRNWTSFDILPQSAVKLHGSVGRQDERLLPRATSLDPKEVNHNSLRESLVRILSSTRLDATVVSSLKGASDPLEALLEQQFAASQIQYEFRQAHMIWQALGQYRVAKQSSDDESVLLNLTDNFRQGLERHGAEKVAIESRIIPSQLRKSVHLVSMREMAERRQALRIKMWYISDVRNSSIYEDALLVTRTLRSMASSRKNKQPSSLANWARQRLRGSSAYDRADRQALETMSASKEHGGLSKLADDQVDLTSQWLAQGNIENFCSSEERFHRFCYEVSKSVNKLAGSSLLENPVLWASHLFRQERHKFDSRPRRQSSPLSPYGPLTPPITAYRFGSSSTPRTAAGLSPMSPTQHVSKEIYDRAYGSSLAFGADYGHVQNHDITSARTTQVSRAQDWGHLTPPATPRFSAFREDFDHPSGLDSNRSLQDKVGFVQELHQNLLALILSDLGYLLWDKGSETDAWVNKAAVITSKNAMTELDDTNRKRSSSIAKSQSTAPVPVSMGTNTTPEQTAIDQMNDSREQDTDLPKTAMSSTTFTPDFQYDDAFSIILKRLSATHDPWSKLESLSQLNSMVQLCLEDESSNKDHATYRLQQNRNVTSKEGKDKILQLQSTQLKGTIASCAGRRANTMKRDSSLRPRVMSASFFAPLPFTEQFPISADRIVQKLLSIFRDSSPRPTTLYRDLQYIASFVPSATLDQTHQGKAFWDAGLAALALKEDLTAANIRKAFDITEHHINVAKAVRIPPSIEDYNSVALTLKPIEHSSTTLRDAALLWLVAAKEGSAVAARELALFYLTHPQLLRRRIMPLARTKDVFGPTSRISTAASGALDAPTFAVVLHWMDIAAKAGDAEAREFLKAHGALGKVS